MMFCMPSSSSYWGMIEFFLEHCAFSNVQRWSRTRSAPILKFKLLQFFDFILDWSFVIKDKRKKNVRGWTSESNIFLHFETKQSKKPYCVVQWNIKFPIMNDFFIIFFLMQWGISVFFQTSGALPHFVGLKTHLGNSSFLRIKSIL